MTNEEIFAALTNNNASDVSWKASYYLHNEDTNVVVRISNHLPKVDNLLSNNEDVEMYFVFSTDILDEYNETEIDEYFESIEGELNRNGITLSNFSVVVAQCEDDLYRIKKAI